MPGTINSLFVVLGLDARPFNQGKADNARQLQQWKAEVARIEEQIRQIRLNSTKATRVEDQKALVQLRDQLTQKKKSITEVEKFQKAEIARQKQLGEQVGIVKDQFLGLLAVFGLSVGLADFVKSTIEGDAATGRFAANLGLSTEELSNWQGALRQVGGTSADAVNSLQALVQAFQDITLRGDTSKLGDLQGLGLQVGDLQNPTEALLKMADAKERLHMSNAEFANRAGALGVTPQTIILLEKGRAAVLAYLAAEDAAYPIRQRDADQAAEAQRQLSLLSDTYKRLGNDILNEALPALIQVGGWASANAPEVEGAFLGIAAGIVAMNAAAILAAAPIIGIAGAFALAGAAIAAAIKNMEDWNKLTAPQKAAQVAKAGAAIAGAQPNEGTLIAGGAHPAAAKAAAQAAGQAIATPPGQPQDGRIRRPAAIEAYLEKNGYTAAQARGIVAGIMAEGGSFTAHGPVIPKTGHRAYGIEQLLSPDRLAYFKSLFGHAYEQSTPGEQLQFLLADLVHDKGGAGVRAQTSVYGTANAYIGGFMRPGAGYLGDMIRVNDFLARTNGGASGGAPAGATSQTDIDIQSITINTQATDAAAIARDIGPAIKRGIPVNQANTGLF